MKKLIGLVAVLMLLLTGCDSVIAVYIPEDDTATDYNLEFSESDLDSSYTVNGSSYITLGDEDISITKGGTYILEGTLNGSIIVDVTKDYSVQLVLNNVTINSGDFAGIYIIEADNVTITLADGSTNTISDSSEYTLIDDNNVDALIYSKADLTINGTGTLVLNSSYNHGIVSKDDLVITGGTYNIDVAGQGLRGKDCVKISDGNFTINSGKDAIKSDNEEDEYRGYVYITGGTFNINSLADGIYGYNMVDIEGGEFSITTSKSSDADSYKGIKSSLYIYINGGTIDINSADDGIHSDGNVYIVDGTIDINSSDDGIHANGMLQIDGGNITISGYEGLEATYIVINGGTIYITATDDGINATNTLTSTYSCAVEINGGYVNVTVGQGDTDGIDSNGYIYINGGTVEINAQNPLDCDGGQEWNGGTVIINGEEVDELPTDMMAGAGGMGQTGGFGTMPNSSDFSTNGNSGNSGFYGPGGHH